MTKTFKCTKCKDQGVIARIDEDGNVFAKNCECTELAILQSKLNFADIPTEFNAIKVNDFDSTIYKLEESRKLALAAKTMAKRYVLNFNKYRDAGKGLYFYSRAKGSGKTMLAIAIGNALVNMYSLVQCVKFITTVDLLSEIRKTYSNDSNISDSELISTIKNVPVLILDDIGTEKLTGWVNETLYQIINYRSTAKLITIFTSNVHITHLQHDERIRNRIERMANPISLPEESIRGMLAQFENEAMTKELLGM